MSFYTLTSLRPGVNFQWFMRGDRRRRIRELIYRAMDSYKDFSKLIYVQYKRVK